MAATRLARCRWRDHFIAGAEEVETHLCQGHAVDGGELDLQAGSGADRAGRRLQQVDHGFGAGLGQAARRLESSALLTVPASTMVSPEPVTVTEPPLALSWIKARKLSQSELSLATSIS